MAAKELASSGFILATSASERSAETASEDSSSDVVSYCTSSSPPTQPISAASMSSVDFICFAFFASIFVSRTNSRTRWRSTSTNIKAAAGQSDQFQ